MNLYGLTSMEMTYILEHMRSIKFYNHFRLKKQSMYFVKRNKEILHFDYRDFDRILLLLELENKDLCKGSNNALLYTIDS
jgi:hypothetical protein